jgi:fructosamine-3-kinase
VNPQLAATLTERLGDHIVGARSQAGGCINDAWRVELAAGGVLFVKSHTRPPARFFEVEAAALSWLAEGTDDDGSVAVPRVVAWSDAAPAFLAMEWIEPDARPRHDAGEEALGRGLAALHRAGAPSFGWARDGYVGDLPQPNGERPSWADFYRTRRLEPLARRAVDRGTLPPAAAPALDALFARLDELVGPTEPPARLHGDLWAGNRIVGAGGRSWLVDPAPYGGHREMDLAMMRLFGGFGARAFAAYHESHPLADGHHERLPLYQLYPLLVHVTLFGSGYASQVMRALDTYR